jgi:hypothetical protein
MYKILKIIEENQRVLKDKEQTSRNRYIKYKMPQKKKSLEA